MASKNNNTAFEDYRAEIEYAAYDDHSRCFFYGIRVARTLGATGERQVSQVKRRRFREFVQLAQELGRSKAEQQQQNQIGMVTPRLPSKIFATAPGSRKPKLEAFLNALIAWDASANPQGAMPSPVLARFLGLDSKHAFPPKSETFEEFEAANPESMDQFKRRLAFEVAFVVLCFFGTYHVILISILALERPYRPSSSIVAFSSGIFGAGIAILLIQIWHARDRSLRKREFEFEQQLRSSKVKLEHKPIDDFSISKAEAANLPKLRERLVDFASGTTPEYDEKYLQDHGHVLEGLLKTKYQGKATPVILSDEARMRAWEETVLVDHRLVPYLRFNRNSVDKAESQARFALNTRVALDLERIVSDEPAPYRPPDHIFSYVTCPLLRDLSQRPIAQRRERIDRWWVRDRDGCLCTFARLGYLPSGFAFEHCFKRDADAMNLAMLWFVELFKGDLDLVHIESKGRVQGHCTVVVDMSGFDLNAQLGTSDVLMMVKKYVPLTSPMYGGLLKRFIIINAPWYVNMLLAIVKPFIPADILDSVRIHSGFNKQKMLDPFIDDKFIPKYLGGSLVSTLDASDHFCRDRVPPFGPFEPDNGRSLLANV